MRTTTCDVLRCLLLSIALLSSPAAFALDCTPLATLPLNGTLEWGQAGITASTPGELVCGFDYTGWDFHAYEFTLSAPALQIVHMAAGDGGAMNHLLILDACDPNACVFSAAGTGSSQTTVQEAICLDAGTYTAIVATQTPAGTVFNVGTQTFDVCTPVANGTSSWGTLKSEF